MIQLSHTSVSPAFCTIQVSPGEKIHERWHFCMLSEILKTITTLGPFAT